jgi:hypothetical protein
LGGQIWVCRLPGQHGREAKNSWPQPGTLFALGDYLIIGYEIPAV